MNGTLHQNAHHEFTKHYQDNLQVRAAKAHLNKSQSDSEQPEAIRVVRGFAQKVRFAPVTTIIALTVLLIALNVGAKIMDGGGGIASNLV